MRPEDQAILSFYREISPIKEGVALIQHIDANQIYVRKRRSLSDEALYLMLQKMAVPGIPRIHHIIRDETNLIIIEEHINHPTLEQRLNGDGIFTAHETIRIAVELCRILNPLHEADPPVIHRDLKPSNLLVAPEGRVWLIDFNAAKTYDHAKKQDTVLMGTADFAAPEQFGFRQSDARTDVYGLGVLMNVMLTGVLPKERLHDGPLRKVVAKCTSLDPADRYRSVRQVAEVLERIRKNLRVSRHLYGENTDDHRGGENADSCAFARQPSKGFVSWLPPGFRTRTPWKMALACIGYAMLLYMGLGKSVEGDPGFFTFFNRMCALTSLLLPVFFIGNYRGLSNHFPMAGSAFVWLHVLGSLLWSTVFTLALLMLCVLLDLLRDGLL